MDIQKKTPNQLKPADFVGSFRYKNNPEIELTTNVGFSGKEESEPMKNPTSYLHSHFFADCVT